MKKLLSVLVILMFATTAFSQKEIKLEDVRNNIGDTVKICTRIFDGKYDENSKGNPTYLYTSANNPNNTLTLIIWGEKRKSFDYKPEKDLKERDVCAMGKLELIKDKPVMVIEKQSQIDIK